MASAREGNARRWTRSLRLVLEERGGEIRLISKQRVNMIPPPALAAPGEGQSGAWAELRTANDEAVYHHLIAHLSAPGVEVFSPDPKQSVRRIDDASVTKTIVIVVPDTDDARSLVIMGHTARRADARVSAAEAFRAGTGEIARFDLSDDAGNGGRS